MLFWRHHPALLYGIASLIGSALAFGVLSWIFCSCVLFFMLPFSLTREALLRSLLALICTVASFYISKQSYQFPLSQDIGKQGLADLSLASISASSTPFGQIWKYKGTLISFSDNNGHTIAKNIPIQFTIPNNGHSQRPEADKRYQIKTRLKSSVPGKYGLTIAKNTTWEPMENSFSGGEWRFKAKSNFQEHIKKNISDQHVSSFLSGIATGEFDNMYLTSELGRFGLQHLMAISGLHFSILASIISIGLCLFLSTRTVAVILMLILSAYFIFLGNSPSILRSWISLLVALGGVLLGKQSSGLNSLGIGLLVVSFWDPHLMFHIGFQFSFGITAAILLWYMPCDQLMQKFFIKRSLSQMTKLSSLEQHAYCLLCFLRQTLSLALAVNLVALPLTLFYFHKFPLMSLVYNLFFPFMVSLCMLLLIIACCSYPFFAVVGQFFHHINEKYTQFLLNFTFNLPKTFDSSFYLNDISINPLLAYLLFIYITGIFLKQSIDTKEYMPEWMVR